MLALDHNNCSTQIKNRTIPDLRTLSTDVRTRSRTLQSQMYQLDEAMDEAQRKKDDNLNHLEQAIQGTGSIEFRDPWLAHQVVRSSLSNKIEQEKHYRSNMGGFIDEYADREARLVDSLKTIIRNFHEWTFKGNAVTNEAIRSAQMIAESFPADAEFLYFKHMNPNLFIDPNVLIPDVDEVQYLGRDHSAVQTLRTGIVGRKVMGGTGLHAHHGALQRGWRDSYCVMTSRGWLHFFDEQNSYNQTNPELSIYLPEAVLGPHSLPNFPPNSFELKVTKGVKAVITPGTLRWYTMWLSG